MNINFISSLPSSYTDIDTFLDDRGFVCKVENTCDPQRWQFYIREFKNDSSNVLLRVVLRFELLISDSPTASFDENHELYFNDAYLEVWDRQIQFADSFMEDDSEIENSERPKKIGNYALSPSAFVDIEKLLMILDT